MDRGGLACCQKELDTTGATEINWGKEKPFSVSPSFVWGSGRLNWQKTELNRRNGLSLMYMEGHRGKNWNHRSSESER